MMLTFGILINTYLPNLCLLIFFLLFSIFLYWIGKFNIIFIRDFFISIFIFLFIINCFFYFYILDLIYVFIYYDNIVGIYYIILLYKFFMSFFFFFLFVCLVIWLLSLYYKFTEKSLPKIAKALFFIMLFLLIIVIICFIVLTSFLSQYIAAINLYAIYNIIIRFFYLHFVHFDQFLTSFGWSILLICLINSLFSAYFLYKRNLLTINTVFFFFFNFFLTFIILTTTNLLIIFVCFEIILFSSMWVCWLRHTTVLDNRGISLIKSWVSGLAANFFGLMYVSDTFNTFDFTLIDACQLPPINHNMLYLCFFFGFVGRLLLVTPFFGLVQICKDIPIGFSMYLLGFLSQLTLYCFFIAHFLFKYFVFTESICLGFLFICLSWILSNLTQCPDIKELFFYIITQDVIITYFIMFANIWMGGFLVNFFCIIQNLLVVYLCFLVDVAERLFKTTNIKDLYGLCHICPDFLPHFKLLLFLYSGCPGTVRFAIFYMILTLFGLVLLKENSIIIFLFFFSSDCYLLYHLLHFIYYKPKLEALSHEENKVQLRWSEDDTTFGMLMRLLIYILCLLFFIIWVILLLFFSV